MRVWALAFEAASWNLDLNDLRKDSLGWELKLLKRIPETGLNFRPDVANLAAIILKIYQS